MGAGVSNWQLAKAVSQNGQMGVVSGLALDTINARRLQLGDQEGHIRRALSYFPWPAMADRFHREYYIPGGKPLGKPFKLLQRPVAHMKQADLENTIVGNFIEVFLAKENHQGLIGVNYLEKIQLPILPSLFGAMLAGVDYVLMGGGLPLTTPGILDKLSRFETVELRIHMARSDSRLSCIQQFDPRAFRIDKIPDVKRPKFLAIISSDTAAKSMLRRSTGQVDGFVIETHMAGGHNAPPRKTHNSNVFLTPRYGSKDAIDLQKIRSFGLPFWLAGGYASPLALRDALDAGAIGVQIGTAFAFCMESGISMDIKREIIQRQLYGHLNVHTDFEASPTGYPFKVVSVDGCQRHADNGGRRQLICDLGYLRHPYYRKDQGVGYRCPAEPIHKYLQKGGFVEETVGKRCLCNGLLATIGLGQIRGDGAESPIVTSGKDLAFMPYVLNGNGLDYTANNVIRYIMSGPDRIGACRREMMNIPN